MVVASVHSHMSLERTEMTERLLAAIENPYTQIIAHPTGRLILQRDPFDYDMERVFNAAAKYGVAMECNAYPDRLDLSDVHLPLRRIENTGTTQNARQGQRVQCVMEYNGEWHIP